MKHLVNCALFAVLIVSLSCFNVSAQSNLTANIGKTLIKQYPKFKGVEYQLAVYDYIKDYFRNYDLTNRSNMAYYPVIAFDFREDGSLAEASIVRTTGSKSLDDKLLKLCKDFTRKKYMTPANSGEGPIACTVEVLLEFNYTIMKDFSNEGNYSFIGYRKLQKMGFGGYPRDYFHTGW
ncbi:MAG: hypothetical protein J6X91_02605 [Bacteroidales bacterium]|nr:hypothetical protein [Bacteroidales bacterium]